MNNFESLFFLMLLWIFTLWLNCAGISRSSTPSHSMLCGLIFRKPFGLKTCWIICKHSERRQLLHEAQAAHLHANELNVMTETQNHYSVLPFRWKPIYFCNISNRKLSCNFLCQYIIYFVINN